MWDWPQNDSHLFTCTSVHLTRSKKISGVTCSSEQM